MRVQIPWAALQVRNPVGRIGIRRDATSLARLRFLNAATRIGLILALRSPRTADELVEELCVVRPELLDATLRVGVALGELSLSNGRYRIRGARAKAIADDDGALASLPAEL